jgi:hypothetical protein
MANLGANLWRHGEEGKIASICAGRTRYVAKYQSRSHCAHRAMTQIECRANVGHPFWNRDFCERTRSRDSRDPSGSGSHCPASS